ncbi:MAG: sn-glycerol-3-phosphate ABC transporter ATP-binding protein UgpC [Deltaproteobacteria bacterium]|nr:sn-glycerol-3-phosphate ABC transporter ATP-binding protein UgpC [Deltaproteobacteria bacterium]
MAKVVFKKVVKSYGEVTVVPELDLEIEDGRFTVLVGPSGCGKSTTLRMIAGLEEVTSGDLLIGERKVNNVLPRDRDIAMVFQSYALYPHMTVRENMAFGLKLRKIPQKEIAARVDEVATMLSLNEYLDRKPKALSGGQRQRVAMGRAIVRRPSVFLFDEPLSNLDAKLRGEMRREIAKLHQTIKTTIVYVTHDQVEAMTLADNIVVMEKGIIRQKGQPLELYHKPANRFVAGFIGSPTMNFVDCKVENGKLSSESFSIKIPDNFNTENHQKVTLGIRPEDVMHVEKKEDGVIEGTAEIVEPLGAEILVTFNTDSASIMAGFEPTFKIAVGDKVMLKFPPDKIHIFAADSMGDSLRRA